MDLGEVFEQQIAMEQMVATIFRRFGERFASCPEASHLWNHMAEEEDRHSGALYWCRSLLIDVGARAKPCLGCDDESRRGGMETLAKMLSLSENPDLTMDQAVFLTVRIENLATEKLLSTLLNLPENDIFREVADQIVGDEKDHARHVNTLVGLLPVISGSKESLLKE